MSQPMWPERGWPMDRESLADLLEHMAVQVREGNSVAGRISWEPEPADQDGPPAEPLSIRAFYRVGHGSGSGRAGARVIGDI